MKNNLRITAFFFLVTLLAPAVPARAEDAPIPVYLFIPGFFTPKEGDRNPVYQYLEQTYKRSHPEADELFQSGRIRIHTGRPPSSVSRDSSGENEYPGLIHPDLKKPGVADTDLAYESAALFFLIHGLERTNTAFLRKHRIKQKNAGCLYRSAQKDEDWRGLTEEFRAKTGREIRITFVATSAGALKVREYLRLCEIYHCPHRTERIIFLSGAHNGSSIPPDLNAFFDRFLTLCLRDFRARVAAGESLSLSTATGGRTNIPYTEIDRRGVLSAVEGDGMPNSFLRKLFVTVIINFIPFDGGMTLGRMTTVRQLNPGSSFIANLKDRPFPEEILVYNVTSREPQSGLFRNAARAMEEGDNLTPSDGVLTIQDTLLPWPSVRQIYVARPADHAKMARLEVASDIKNLIRSKYRGMRFMLRNAGAGYSRRENELMIEACFKALLRSAGYDIDDPETMENTSIFDAFIDNDMMSGM